MDVISVSQARRFSRDRPSRVSIFDRPRLVCDLICLEPGQQENRRHHSASDEMYLVIEGKARLQVGPQTSEVEANEAVLVPPGVEHSISNPGPGRLAVLAFIAPKPARASEIPIPAAEASRRLPPRPPSRQGPGGEEFRTRPPIRPRRPEGAQAPRPPRGPARPQSGPRRFNRGGSSGGQR